MENYAESGIRLFNDGKLLHDSKKFATACHLYGLAAECAIKAFLENQTNCTKIPFKHLPDLVDDAKRLLSGRVQAHLFNLISSPNYFDGWKVENRYWAVHCFDQQKANLYKVQSQRTVQCIPGA